MDVPMGATMEFFGTGLTRLPEGEQDVVRKSYVEPRRNHQGNSVAHAHRRRENFPVRNRIVAGHAAAGVVVVEARPVQRIADHERFGHGIGRELFGVPGNGTRR